MRRSRFSILADAAGATGLAAVLAVAVVVNGQSARTAARSKAADREHATMSITTADCTATRLAGPVPPAAIGEPVGSVTLQDPL